MRILLISEYVPASERVEITGGVEAYVHYVSAHLQREHDVVVLARRTDGSVWDPASVTSLPGRILFLFGALFRGLRDPGDVVVATTYVVHPVGWLVAKLRRRPIVFWYPDVLIGSWRNGQFGGAAGLIGELTERLLLRLPVDRYIAISESTAGKLVDHGVAPERVSVVPCGYEPEVLDAIEPPPSDAPYLVVVGRLVPYKRVDVVVRALALLAKTTPDVRLVVIGQGPERDNLERLALGLGVSGRIDWLGFVDRHVEVLSTVAGASAYVSASEIEGFGIAVVEAMALGTPYAVTSIPAFEEVTGGGVGGALFPHGDEGALASHLERLLVDAVRRQRLGSEGAEHARQYTWQRVATATADVLRATVERSRGRDRPFRLWRRRHAE